MPLDTSINKAISVAALCGLTLAPAGRAELVDPPELLAPRDSVAPPELLAPRESVASPELLSPPEPVDAPEAKETSTSSGAKAKTVEASRAPAGAQGACANGMLLVEGDYCPDADQVCLKWLDPPPYQNLRCGEYAKPAKCKVPRQHRRFCVDRDEHAEAIASGVDPLDALPAVNKSWLEAKSICEGRGARLCKESEWEFACEGVDMNPYPYGFKRDSTLCNHDRTDLGGAQEKLNDHRAPLSAFPACTSPFGAHDMIGNVDEWVEREGVPAPHRSALRGGWWLPGRNRCRAATLHHDESYSAKQVGFRCCADAR